MNAPLGRRFAAGQVQAEPHSGAGFFHIDYHLADILIDKVEKMLLPGLRKAIEVMAAFRASPR